MDKRNIEMEKVESGVVEEIEVKGLPTYMETIKLTEEQKLRLIEDVTEEIGAIDKERQAQGFEEKIYSLRRQYEGIVPDTLDMEFKLHKHTTKIKCDTIRRHLLQAFLEPQPHLSVSPRPEFQRQDGAEIAENVEDWVDYLMDERIKNFRPTCSKVFKDAIGLPVGLMKLSYFYREIKKKRPERFQTVNDFLERYPNAKEVESYKGILTDLAKVQVANASREEDKKRYLEYIVDYNEIASDDVKPQWTDPIKFKCRMYIDNYEDLKYARYKGEEEEFSWWQLKQLEKDGIMPDVEELKYEIVKDDRTGKLERRVRIGYQYETYKIVLNDFWFKLNEEDKEETHILFWHDVDKDIITGCINYPYYYVDCMWFPFWVDDSTQGWMKQSVADYITETNLAEDIMLNLMLQYFYIRSTITPISAENSPTSRQFLENRWTWGMNIDTDGQPLQFAQQYLQNVSAKEMISVIQYMVQDADEVTGMSSLMSGRESPLDPRAPAAKTIALLEKSGISIKDYVQALAPSFNNVAQAIIAFYYQFSEEKGMRFKSREQKITGGPVFKDISRKDMMAQVNLQTQATIFNFEKKNEKQEDLALLQVLRQEPLIANNPEAVYRLLRNIVKGWSPKWRRLVKQILPPIDQFRQDQLKMVIQGVSIYAENKLKESMIDPSGAPPKLDARELLQGLQQMLKETATPPSKEEVKAREQAAKEQQKGGVAGAV